MTMATSDDAVGPRKTTGTNLLLECMEFSVSNPTQHINVENDEEKSLGEESINNDELEGEIGPSLNKTSIQSNNSDHFHKTDNKKSLEQYLKNEEDKFFALATCGHPNDASCDKHFQVHMYANFAPPENAAKFNAEEWSGRHQSQDTPLTPVQREFLIATSEEFDQDKAADPGTPTADNSNLVVSGFSSGIPIIEGQLGTSMIDNVMPSMSKKRYVAEEWSGFHDTQQTEGASTPPNSLDIDVDHSAANTQVFNVEQSNSSLGQEKVTPEILIATSDTGQEEQPQIQQNGSNMLISGIINGQPILQGNFSLPTLTNIPFVAVMSRKRYQAEEWSGLHEDLSLSKDASPAPCNIDEETLCPSDEPNCEHQVDDASASQPGLEIDPVEKCVHNENCVDTDGISKKNEDDTLACPENCTPLDDTVSTMQECTSEEVGPIDVDVVQENVQKQSTCSEKPDAQAIIEGLEHDLAKQIVTESECLESETSSTSTVNKSEAAQDPAIFHQDDDYVQEISVEAKQELPDQSPAVQEQTESKEELLENSTATTTEGTSEVEENQPVEIVVLQSESAAEPSQSAADYFANSKKESVVEQEAKCEIDNLEKGLVRQSLQDPAASQTLENISQNDPAQVLAENIPQPSSPEPIVKEPAGPLHDPENAKNESVPHSQNQEAPAEDIEAETEQPRSTNIVRDDPTEAPSENSQPSLKKQSVVGHQIEFHNDAENFETETANTHNTEIPGEPVTSEPGSNPGNANEEAVEIQTVILEQTSKKDSTVERKESSVSSSPAQPAENSSTEAQKNSVTELETEPKRDLQLHIEVELPKNQDVPRRDIESEVQEITVQHLQSKEPPTPTNTCSLSQAQAPTPKPGSPPKIVSPIGVEDQQRLNNLVHEMQNYAKSTNGKQHDIEVNYSTKKQNRSTKVVIEGPSGAVKLTEVETSTQPGHGPVSTSTTKNVESSAFSELSNVLKKLMSEVDLLAKTTKSNQAPALSNEVKSGDRHVLFESSGNYAKSHSESKVEGSISPKCELLDSLNSIGGVLGQLSTMNLGTKSCSTNSANVADESKVGQSSIHSGGIEHSSSSSHVHSVEKHSSGTTSQIAAEGVLPSALDKLISEIMNTCRNIASPEHLQNVDQKLQSSSNVSKSSTADQHTEFTEKADQAKSRTAISGEGHVPPKVENLVEQLVGLTNQLVGLHGELPQQVSPKPGQKQEIHIHTGRKKVRNETQIEINTPSGSKTVVSSSESGTALPQSLVDDINSFLKNFSKTVVTGTKEEPQTTSKDIGHSYNIQKSSSYTKHSSETKTEGGSRPVKVEFLTGALGTSGLQAAQSSSSDFKSSKVVHEETSSHSQPSQPTKQAFVSSSNFQSGSNTQEPESLEDHVKNHLAKLGINFQNPVVRVMKSTHDMDSSSSKEGGSKETVVNVQYSKEKNRKTNTVTIDGGNITNLEGITDHASLQKLLEDSIKSLENVGKVVHEQVNQQKQAGSGVFPAHTDQQQESTEEGFLDEHGNVVVSKKITRIVTTTKTVPGNEPQVETVQTTEEQGHPSSSSTGLWNKLNEPGNERLIRLKVDENKFEGTMDDNQQIQLHPTIESAERLSLTNIPADFAYGFKNDQQQQSVPDDGSEIGMILSESRLLSLSDHSASLTSPSSTCSVETIQTQPVTHFPLEDGKTGLPPFPSLLHISVLKQEKSNLFEQPGQEFAESDVAPSSPPIVASVRQKISLYEQKISIPSERPQESQMEKQRKRPSLDFKPVSDDSMIIHSLSIQSSNLKTPNGQLEDFDQQRHIPQVEQELEATIKSAYEDQQNQQMYDKTLTNKEPQSKEQESKSSIRTSTASSEEQDYIKVSDSFDIDLGEKTSEIETPTKTTPPRPYLISYIDLLKTFAENFAYEILLEVLDDIQNDFEEQNLKRMIVEPEFKLTPVEIAVTPATPRLEDTEWPNLIVSGTEEQHTSSKDEKSKTQEVTFATTTIETNLPSCDGSSRPSSEQTSPLYGYNFKSQSQTSSDENEPGSRPQSDEELGKYGRSDSALFQSLSSGRKSDYETPFSTQETDYASAQSHMPTSSSSQSYISAVSQLSQRSLAEKSDQTETESETLAGSHRDSDVEQSDDETTVRQGETDSKVKPSALSFRNQKLLQSPVQSDRLFTAMAEEQDEIQCIIEEDQPPLSDAGDELEKISEVSESVKDLTSPDDKQLSPFLELRKTSKGEQGLSLSGEPSPSWRSTKAGKLSPGTSSPKEQTIFPQTSLPDDVLIQTLICDTKQEHKFDEPIFPSSRSADSLYLKRASKQLVDDILENQESRDSLSSEENVMYDMAEQQKELQASGIIIRTIEPTDEEFYRQSNLDTVPEEPEVESSVESSRFVSQLRKDKRGSNDNVSETSLQEFERFERELALRGGENSLSNSEIELLKRGLTVSSSPSSLVEFERATTGDSPLSQSQKRYEDVMILSDIHEEVEVEEHPESALFTRFDVTTLEFDDDCLLNEITNQKPKRSTGDKSTGDFLPSSMTEADSSHSEDTRHHGTQKDSLLESPVSCSSTDIKPESSSSAGRPSAGGKTETDDCYTFTMYESKTDPEDSSLEIIRTVSTKKTDPVSETVKFTGIDSQEQFLNYVQSLTDDGYDYEEVESVDDSGNVTKTVIRRIKRSPAAADSSKTGGASDSKQFF